MSMSARLHITAHYGPDSREVITGWIEARFDHRVIVDNHEHLDYRVAMRWGGGGENAHYANIIALAFYPVEGGMYVMSGWHCLSSSGQIRMILDAVMYSVGLFSLPGDIWPLNPQFLNHDVQLRFTGPAVDRIVDFIGSLRWNIQRHASGYVLLSNTDPQYEMLEGRLDAAVHAASNRAQVDRPRFYDRRQAEDEENWEEDRYAEEHDWYSEEHDFLDLPEEYSSADELDFNWDALLMGDGFPPVEFDSDQDEEFQVALDNLNLNDLFDRPAVRLQHWAPAAVGPRHAWQALEGQDPSDVSTLYANATDDDKKKFDDWECAICYRKMKHNAEGDAEVLASIEHNENELVSAHPPETPDLHHVFHRYCLERWYRDSALHYRPRTCPTCRHNTREISHEPLPAVWSPGNTRLAACMETKLLTTHATRNPYIIM